MSYLLTPDEAASLREWWAGLDDDERWDAFRSEKDAANSLAARSMTLYATGGNTSTTTSEPVTEAWTGHEARRVAAQVGLPYDWRVRIKANEPERAVVMATAGPRASPLLCGHRSITATDRTLALAVARLARWSVFHQEQCNVYARREDHRGPVFDAEGTLIPEDGGG